MFGKPFWLELDAKEGLIVTNSTLSKAKGGFIVATACQECTRTHAETAHWPHKICGGAGRPPQARSNYHPFVHSQQEEMKKGAVLNSGCHCICHQWPFRPRRPSHVLIQRLLPLQTSQQQQRCTHVAHIPIYYRVLSLSLEQVMSSIQLAAVTDLDRWRTQQQQGRCRLLSLAHCLAIAGIIALLPTSPPSPLSVQSLSSSYSPCTGDDFEGGQF